jgi:phospholipid transport system substrate-binding protein
MIFKATFTRRATLATLAGSVISTVLPGTTWALTSSEARSLVDKLTAEVMRVINSGVTGEPMYREFEKIFAKYADVRVIARRTLGVEWKLASSSQQTAYVAAFRGYMARKYGKRFKEFIGSEIIVTGARKEKSFYVVDSTVKLAGSSPFEVNWLVSDRSGKDLMFNLIIEGINMLLSEREEIGLMLDKNGGNLDKLVSELKRAG